MKKRPVKFYFVLSVVLAAAFFGLGFVVSQTSNSFNSVAVPNPGHDASQVYCNNCVKSNVIEDGTIIDADVSFGAAIGVTKLNGYNGHFLQGVTLNNGAVTSISQSTGWGVANWVGKSVEVICDQGATTDGDVFAYGGVTDIYASNQYRVLYNHYITAIPGVGLGVNLGGSLGNDWAKVYDYAEKTAGATPTTQRSRSLYIRVDPSNPAQLQLAETINGAPFIGSWTCHIDFVYP
jgi:hypothetical protein